MLGILEVQLNPLDHINLNTLENLVNVEVLNLSYLHLNYLSRNISNISQEPRNIGLVA